MKVLLKAMMDIGPWAIQSNFDGWKTFGTMKTSSRQGYFELMSANHSAKSGGIIGIYFSIFFNMKVYCVFSLESPHRGDSNVNTQYSIFYNEKENHPRLF